jgi:hypothetical protein
MKMIGKCLMTTVATGALVMAGQVKAQTPAPTYTPAPAYNPPAPAYNPPPGPPPTYANESIVYPYYHAQELSVDLFGAGTTGESRYDHYYDGYHLRHDARGGGGVGINYFFCKYVGVGADTLSEGLNPFIYSASGNVIGRIPIGNTGLAPYVFAGGGYQFHDDRTGFGQAGAGLDFRFARHLGVFVDGRGVVPGEHRDYGLFRGGLRINF